MTEAEQELIEELRRQNPKAQWLTLQRYGKGIFALMTIIEKAPWIGFQDALFIVLRGNIVTHELQVNTCHVLLSHE